MEDITKSGIHKTELGNIEVSGTNMKTVSGFADKEKIIKVFEINNYQFLKENNNGLIFKKILKKK